MRSNSKSRQDGCRCGPIKPDALIPCIAALFADSGRFQLQRRC